MYVDEPAITDFSERDMAPAIDILQSPPRNAAGPRPDDPPGIIVTVKQPSKRLFHAVDRARGW
jgi:hypothetical protein